tara:strand:+ start:1926 stop:2402 length:477 start_codon:yes stop_codon:yes gene_type:complete
MILQLPCVLIRKIVFYLEIDYIYKILLTHSSLLTYNFQKFCISQFYRNNLICKNQNSNEIYELVKDLKNNYNFTLGQYLHTLKTIINSKIYYKNRDNNYLTNNRNFKFKRTINFIYNDIDFYKKKTPKYIKIHNVYRVNYFTYHQLKKKHLNILALIY